MIEVALSPCPNDTFLFFPWILGYVGRELPIVPHFYDIEELNRYALAYKYPLTKLSIATYGEVIDKYTLLPIGAALGTHNGPKIIGNRIYRLEEIKDMRIAIPGEKTTAHLLLDLFVPGMTNKHFCRYHEALALLKSGTVECALIIHETRFTFGTEGFYEIADLGALFYAQYKMPLPLGGLALQKERRSWSPLLCTILQQSLAFAKEHPEKGMEFILKHSQEKDAAVVKKHIDLYVNAETASLSKKGKAAINLLLNRSIAWKKNY